jgi:glycosyltransferase involved in cell wall biosynthesis
MEKTSAHRPLVTIVTPSLNQGQFIEETILSVLNQTYTNIQYILVDGCSSDDTMKVVEKYRHKINIIIHEKDKGQTDAINKGFKLANGELIGWINSDDMLYPECVEQIVGLYTRNRDGAIYYSSHIDFIDKNGKILKTYQKVISDKNHLLNINYDIIQPGSFYKTKIVRQLNYLNNSLKYCMDLDLWLRLLDKGTIHSFKEKPLSAFRIWEETKTSNGRYKFIREIRKTLLRNKANFFSPNIARSYWYELKDYIKRIIPHFK